MVQVKEIECQKCQKYKVPVAKTKWVKECNPVYDEKCKTEYHQHCKEETRCHIIYQTICDNSGYQQVGSLSCYVKAMLNADESNCAIFSICSTVIVSQGNIATPKQNVTEPLTLDAFPSKRKSVQRCQLRRPNMSKNRNVCHLNLTLLTRVHIMETPAQAMRLLDKY